MAQLRFSKKGSILLVFVLLLISFGIGYTTWKITGSPNLSVTDSSAGGCKSNDKKSCAGSCGGSGYDGKGVYCKWINNGCKESNSVCGGGGAPQVPIKCPNGVTGASCSATDPKCGNFCLNPAWANIPGNPRGCNAAKLALGCSIGATCVDLNGDGDFYDPKTGETDVHNGVPECTSAVTPLAAPIVCTGCSSKITGGCSESEGTSLGSSYYNSGTDRIACKNFCGSIQCDASNGHRDTVCKCDEPDPAKCGDGKIDAGEQCDPPGTVSDACAYGDRICKSDCTCPLDVITENTCDGGSLTLGQPDYIQAPSIGDLVTVEGWAYDRDGINKDKVVVFVDESIHGNATVEDGCNLTGQTQGEACDATKPNVVTWSYTFTSTALSHETRVVWEDIQGLTAARCEGSTTFTFAQINPNWEMTKTAVGVCDETDPENIFLPYEYAVTVTNTSTVPGEITNIVDTLDTGVSESWIDLDSINPAATVSGNVITWNLTGDLASFAAGESKVFTYTVNFPEESFDAINVYTNIVIATPTVGDPFSASESVIAHCEIDTGVFDTTKGRLITGVLLILASIMYVYFDGVNYAVSNVFIKAGSIFGYKSKVVRSRKKFERKW